MEPGVAEGRAVSVKRRAADAGEGRHGDDEVGAGSGRDGQVVARLDLGEVGALRRALVSARTERGDEVGGVSAHPAAKREAGAAELELGIRDGCPVGLGPHAERDGCALGGDAAVVDDEGVGHGEMEA